MALTCPRLDYSHSFLKEINHFIYFAIILDFLVGMFLLTFKSIWSPWIVIFDNFRCWDEFVSFWRRFTVLFVRQLPNHSAGAVGATSLCVSEYEVEKKIKISWGNFFPFYAWWWRWWGKKSHHFSGVNFINILPAAFMCADPKSAKTVNSSSFLHFQDLQA